MVCIGTEGVAVTRAAEIPVHAGSPCIKGHAAEGAVQFHLENHPAAVVNKEHQGGFSSISRFYGKIGNDLLKDIEINRKGQVAGKGAVAQDDRRCEAHDFHADAHLWLVPFIRLQRIDNFGGLA